MPKYGYEECNSKNNNNNNKNLGFKTPHKIKSEI